MRRRGLMIGGMLVLAACVAGCGDLFMLFSPHAGKKPPVATPEPSERPTTLAH
ncbi:hypothetical protein D3C86_2161060 [compost metagenome]